MDNKTQQQQTAIVKLPTKVTIDIGEFMPRIIELANAECRSPEQQVRYMFKRLVDSWDSRSQNSTSFADRAVGYSYPRPKRYYSIDIETGNDTSFAFG